MRTFQNWLPHRIHKNCLASAFKRLVARKRGFPRPNVVIRLEKNICWKKEDKI